MGITSSGTQTTDASTDSNSPTTGKPLPDRSGNNYAPSTPNCSADSPRPNAKD